MSDKDSTNNQALSLLRSALSKDEDNWDQRKKLAHMLYDQGKTKEAAELVWEAPQIPSVDIELGFAIKLLAKGAPRKAIRLLSSVQENNKDKPAQNLGLANALMHHGMVMEAARFDGAAVSQNSELTSADLEHFLLWTDDREKIWGDFDDEKPELGELPWMKRDAKEAAQLAKTMSGHTTPIKIPNLQKVDAEAVVRDMYVQSPRKGAEATPPPAVTIPVGQVNSKDVVVDEKLGAAAPAQSVSPQAAPPQQAAAPRKLITNPPATAATPAPSAPTISAPTAAPVITPKPMMPPIVRDKPGLPQAKSLGDDKVVKPAPTLPKLPQSKPPSP